MNSQEMLNRNLGINGGSETNDFHSELILKRIEALEEKVNNLEKNIYCIENKIPILDVRSRQ